MIYLINYLGLRICYIYNISAYLVKGKLYLGPTFEPITRKHKLYIKGTFRQRFSSKFELKLTGLIIWILQTVLTGESQSGLGVEYGQHIGFHWRVSIGSRC